MEKEIRITCKGATNLSIATLKNFQGTLKTLHEKQFDKLKASIIEEGFFDPVMVWKDKKGTHHIIDGHQRLLVVGEMLKDGWSLNGRRLPCDWVYAYTKEEAKRKVLITASQYGRYNEDTVYEFIHTSGIDFNEVKTKIDLPQIHMGKFQVGWFRDISMGIKSTCPSCGYEWVDG